jgi:hypothetical protein
MSTLLRNNVQEGYVVVSEPSVKKLAETPSKDILPVVDVPLVLKTNGMRSAIRGKLAQVDTVIWGRYTSTSAAGTALVAVTNLTPGSSPEFPSFANIYDEVRCNSIEVLTSYVGQPLTSVLASNCNCLQVYDPSDFSAPTSILNMLPVTQRQKRPFVLYMPTTAAVSTFNGSVQTSLSGYIGWKAKMLSGPHHASALAIIYGHEFAPTAEVADTFGFLKTFIEAPAANATTSFLSWVGYHVTFRSRQ